MMPQVSNDVFQIADSIMYDLYTKGAFGGLEIWQIMSWSRRNSSWMDQMGLSVDHGATKIVIFAEDLGDWVIKFNAKLDDNYKHIDYMAREYENYLKAVEAGYGEYFAATIDCGEAPCGLHYYLQQACMVDDDDKFETLYDTLKEQYESCGMDYDDDDLAEQVDEFEDDEICSIFLGVDDDGDFMHWLWDHDINDLHRGNFGWRKNHYVILDYSGYYG